MAITLPDVAMTLATSVATAVVTAAITVRLSVKQFQSQKWWELKVEAYTRIIEALQAMYRFDIESFDASIEGRELREAYAERLRHGWSAGKDELNRAVGYGSLVISSESYEALRKLERAMAAAPKHPSWNEYLDLESDQLAQCLNDVRHLAARDLGVAPPRALTVITYQPTAYRRKQSRVSPIAPVQPG